MKNLTILIHTRNEEKHIKDCIESARLLCDNIIVVDMESTDKTIEIAKMLGATVLSFPFSRYVEPAREFAIQKAKTEWVFILDADERITKELADEVKSIIGIPSRSKNRQQMNENPQPTHYSVPRKNMFGGKTWLKHGGWWPDRQTRLIKKESFISWPKEIHSTPSFRGQKGELTEPLTHLFHGDLHDMVEKTLLFEDIEATMLFEAGRPVGTLTFFRKFFGELYRRLIKHRGFLDGTIGIIESIYQAYSKTITYLFLYEKRSNTTQEKNRTV